MCDFSRRPFQLSARTSLTVSDGREACHVQILSVLTEIAEAPLESGCRTLAILEGQMLRVGKEILSGSKFHPRGTGAVVRARTIAGSRGAREDLQERSELPPESSDCMDLLGPSSPTAADITDGFARACWRPNGVGWLMLVMSCVHNSRVRDQEPGDELQAGYPVLRSATINGDGTVALILDVHGCQNFLEHSINEIWTSGMTGTDSHRKRRRSRQYLSFFWWARSMRPIYCASREIKGWDTFTRGPYSAPIHSWRSSIFGSESIRMSIYGYEPSRALRSDSETSSC